MNDEITQGISEVARAASSATPSTERRHPGSTQLDEMSTLSVLELLNSQDMKAIDAVRGVLPVLATLVERSVDRVRAGGRVHYFGAGTSGRLGILDAAELIPTFNTDPSLVEAHVAGGAIAFGTAIEGSEDSVADGARDAAAVDPGDVVIGITASGTTPYVRGALNEARARGAYTAVITSNPDTPLRVHADLVVAADTGPEVLTGSTRLKAGTAAKVILNGFSTAMMVGLGRTYSNLMVSVVATNQKLRERTLRILAEVSGEAPPQNSVLLDDADGDLKVAVVCAITKASVDAARGALIAADGSVRDAVTSLTAS